MAKRSRKISAGVSPRAMRTFVETKVAPQTATEKSAARWYRYDPDFDMAAQKYVFFSQTGPSRPPGRAKNVVSGVSGASGSRTRRLPERLSGGFREFRPAAFGMSVRGFSGAAPGGFRRIGPCAAAGSEDNFAPAGIFCRGNRAN